MQLWKRMNVDEPHKHLVNRKKQKRAAVKLHSKQCVI